MRRRVSLAGRVWLRFIVFIAVLGGGAPTVQWTTAAATAPPMLDLAAMIPHPLDIPGGFRQGNGNLHSELDVSIYDPFFLPAKIRPVLTDLTLDLLRRSGWTRTYSNTVGRVDPDTTTVYDRSIRFAIAEFRGEFDARLAATGLANLYGGASYDVSDVTLRDGTAAKLALSREKSDSGERVEPTLLFQVEHLVALIEFSDNIDRPFYVDDVAAVADLFQKRINLVLTQSGATLGLQALRLKTGDVVPLTTEWYLRRDGRDLPFAVDPGGERQWRALGAATDVYSVGQDIVEAEQTETFRTFLLRFPNPQEAQSWTFLWDDYLQEVGWGPGLREAGTLQADRVLLYRSDGDPSVTYRATTVVVADGRNALSLYYLGTQPLDAILALAEAQLDCLARDTSCEPLALPAPSSSDASTPVASPIASAGN